MKIIQYYSKLFTGVFTTNIRYLQSLRRHDESVRHLQRRRAVHVGGQDRGSRKKEKITEETIATPSILSHRCPRLMYQNYLTVLSNKN